MIVRYKQREPGTFGVFSNIALKCLKKETFRVYCFILNGATSKENGTDWEIRPKHIAKELGISVTTIMRSFREMREQGFMDFETDENGNIPRSLNAKGQVVRDTEYRFFEVPELQTSPESKPDQKVDPSRNETGSEMKQETRSEMKQETRSETDQAPNIYKNQDQTEIKQTEETNRESKGAPVTGPLLEAHLPDYQNLGIYGHYFPQGLKQLTVYQREQLGAFPNKGVLNVACQKWAGNGYRDTSISRLLDFCEELQQERASPLHGGNGHRKMSKTEQGLAELQAW